jgi:hypothetical protein
MPDLLTHSAAAYVAARRWFPRPSAILFIFGTMLPDVLSRPFYIVFPILHWWVMPLHTPVGIAIVCWIIADFFQTADRKIVFISVLAGAVFHFLLDAPQKHVAAGYFWLFPFSWATYEWGWWWSEDSVRMVPFVVLLIALLEILIHFRSRRTQNKL